MAGVEQNSSSEEDDFFQEITVEGIKPYLFEPEFKYTATQQLTLMTKRF